MSTERPPVWVGHISLTVTDPERSHDFFVAAGMRTIHRGEDIGILELRGGTHLLLFPGDAAGGAAPFDLMVDDLEATHAELTAHDLAVSPILRAQIHDSFTLTDPDGHEVTVQSSHVTGVV